MPRTSNWEFWDSAARWTPEKGWGKPDWAHAPMADEDDDDDEC